jgi:hypothetical protein
MLWVFLHSYAQWFHNQILLKTLDVIIQVAFIVNSLFMLQNFGLPAELCYQK